MMLPLLGREVSSCELQLPSYNDDDSLQTILGRLSSNISKYIELPILVVMGDTSSGKSSLLSMLSGVELPSSQSFTTKCPIRLCMTTSEQTTATVSALDFEKTIDKDEWISLCDTILLAQDHILQTTGKQVSSQVVSVSIQGPDCVNLTLIDLPGWMRSKSDDESDSLVQDTQALIQDFLHNRRSIILAVQPANVDFHNSQILADARLVDPTGERTIPVITKPDLIDIGAEQDVVDLLLGKKMNFGLGFHMVKCRGQAALNASETIDQALAKEMAFFDLTEPWRSVSDRTLFGIHHLRQKLADLQLLHVRKAMPSILQEVRQKKLEAEATLLKMGEPLWTDTDRRRNYQTLCHDLISSLQSSLSGKGGGRQRESSAAKLHSATNEFVAQIKSGALASISSITEGARVLVVSPRGLVKGEVVHVEDSFVCVDRVDEDDVRADVLFDYVGLSTTESIEENDVWSDGKRVCIARSNHSYDILRQIPIHHVRTDPIWLKEQIVQHRTDDLPCFLNMDLFRNVVAAFIEDEWKPPCIALVEKTRVILLEALQERMGEVHGRHWKLRQWIDQHCREAIGASIDQATKEVMHHLEMEKHPYTSDDLFEHISAARQARLRRELEVSLRLDQEGVFDTQAIKTIVEGVFERNQERSVEGQMADEMELALSAYGGVATKRCLDRVPMICWQVFRTFVSSIQSALAPVTDETLQQCMKESPDFEALYKEVSESLEEYTKAIAVLETL